MSSRGFLFPKRGQAFSLVLALVVTEAADAVNPLVPFSSANPADTIMIDVVRISAPPAAKATAVFPVMLLVARAAATFTPAALPVMSKYTIPVQEGIQSVYEFNERHLSGSKSEPPVTWCSSLNICLCGVLEIRECSMLLLALYLLNAAESSAGGRQFRCASAVLPGCSARALTRVGSGTLPRQLGVGCHDLIAQVFSPPDGRRPGRLWD